ncbi:MAG TPA: ABC transporter substrate-binding protein [Alphaproteobacteria bacterium]|nr:ABC transporter substrate-binding protein [Alphaproteobacteria bacterium]
MFHRRAIFALVVAAASCQALLLRPASAEQPAAGAEAFVRSAITHALEVLGNKAISRDERVERLDELFLEYFDVRGMSTFALGPFARSAVDGRREEYVDAFKGYMVRHYFARLEGIGDKYSIEKSRPEGENTVMVETKVGSYSVVWRVRSRDGEFKIMDLVIEGTSLLLVQRSDFGDLLRSNNGSIPQLIEIMHTQGRVAVYSNPYR